MSLADTTSKPAFIELQPDWSKPLRLLTSWVTSIQGNRESGEQRFRVKAKPKLVISYEYRGMAPNAFVTNRVKMIEQLGKAVVCPVWTEYGTALSFATNSVTLNAAITTLKHKVGGWIYVTQGANACFRKITTVATPTINLSSAGADFFPVGFSWAGFSAGARVYPCVLGMKTENTYRVMNLRADRQDAPISVEEL